MPFCENCGKQVSETAKFCSNCGIKIEFDNSDNKDKTIIDSAASESRKQKKVKSNLRNSNPSSPNSDDDQSNIVPTHNSNLVKYIFVLIIISVLLMFSYVNNPTKQDFVQRAMSEYANSYSIDQSTASLTNEIFGQYIDELVLRRDYIFFSTYLVEINDNFLLPDINVKAVGFWKSIFIFY